ncbi:hypothetical protein DXG03_003003 [Asterophora parasitica]|uniref:DUF6699 domain-containing protein n=1 Tax=Asterophora parasitica TaxID=117018 RepID=A0A9P7K9J7_9AGAR|nr:hypothetical protein DXG03_003003 [Asterophora parasitica]
MSLTNGARSFPAYRYPAVARGRFTSMLRRAYSCFASCLGWWGCYPDLYPYSYSTGIAGGLNGESSERDLAFIHKDEPATIPRVSQLMIITQHSPWCTIVRNDRGVTMGDVCQQLFNEYTQETITDAEFNSINPRLQENIKRAAHALLHGPYANSYYTAAPPPPATIKRISKLLSVCLLAMRRGMNSLLLCPLPGWLRERHWFESLQKDDSYVISRLGFKAPNIFVLSLAQY